ncbi:MGH1-like glycoside hydrolase domain-containing protein [Microbacterium sp. A82]|uniref:MGH1-like glycoside hydrolase domain-containing protein n=1 Tax=unclassified Microbacterium TaxID=2609290 RepID=UPI003F2FD886
MTATVRAEALERLRAAKPIPRAGLVGSPLGAELEASGVRFVAVGGPLEQRWHDALAELDRCIRSIDGPPVLNEGGVYDGCWLESTGTINVEVLDRFAPGIGTDTLLQFAAHQRVDGMIPYKVTPAGPGFSQIQIVTPLARVVWRHYQRTGDRQFLQVMYAAMARYDAWLARYRDTAETGAVEAFCAFDTGHDLSPRFWFAPDRAFGADARYVDPAATAVPYIAPDLTANVACQRVYLGAIADELGEDGAPWRERAEASLDALWAQCFDEDDGLFYDRDRSGMPVRIASDVLLRVLACEVGDEPFFADALRRHLMNTRKFLAHYGFTTIAMDDPRFDHDASRNSWGGPVNMLAQLRAPEAFERHGHVAELALTAQPLLAALVAADRFPQCVDPWSGDAGYTEVYSPSILWFLDALERHSGVLERADGTLWFSGLAPTRLERGTAAEAIGHARTVGSVAWELVADDELVQVYRDGQPEFSFPRGWRVETDAAGEVVAVVGLAAQPVAGVLVLAGAELAMTIAPNERVTIVDQHEADRAAVEFIPPVF